jgi:hypothetical protein
MHKILKEHTRTMLFCWSAGCCTASARIDGMPMPLDMRTHMHSRDRQRTNSADQTWLREEELTLIVTFRVVSSDGMLAAVDGRQSLL